MADTTEAVAVPAADVAQTQSSVEVKSDAKAGAEAAKSDVTMTEATGDDSANKAGDDKPERNGDSKEQNGRRDGGRDTRRGGRGGNGGRGGRGGRGGGSFHKKTRHDNKEFDDLPETDDPEQIRSQVEFYFSSHNLVTDEHLFTKLDGPNNSPVPLKHITNFKRMRHFQPYSAIVAALRESKEVVLVEDGEFSGPGNEGIKRKEAIVIPAKDGDDKNPPSINELHWRFHQSAPNKLDCSAYVKGFGNADEAGQIPLEQFFRPFGAVMVRKRREDSTGLWKGSVFVEFDTEENQKQFLALDPKPKFNDNELTIMGKKEYSKMKCDEKGIKPAWERTDEDKREYNAKNGSRGGGRGRGDRGRGGRGGGGRGGRGGRGGHRDGRDNRNRSRSPRRRRGRSASNDGDSNDWKNRRERFRQGKDDSAGKKDEEKREPKEVERDAVGVPVIKDTRDESSSNKRKADDGERASSPKKNKLEIKQDE